MLLEKRNKESSLLPQTEAIANERRFALCFDGKQEEEGKLRWETEKSSPPCLHMHSVHLRVMDLLPSGTEEWARV